MQAIRIDGVDYAWGPRGQHIVLKTPDGSRHRVPVDQLSPPRAAPLASPHEAGTRHVRWYILSRILRQPERADREARRQLKRERKARRKQCPSPPGRVAQGLRDVYLVIAERGRGAGYSWDVVTVCDCPVRARDLADTRNRRAFEAIRALDPLIPDCKAGELYDVLERRDPSAWRTRVEQRLANHDPATGAPVPALAAE